MKIIKKVGILASMLLMAAGVNVAMAADAAPAGKVAIVNVQQSSAAITTRDCAQQKT